MAGGSETGGNGDLITYTNPNPPAGLLVEHETYGEVVDYGRLADRLERGLAWLKAHYATGTLQCPSDREA